MGFKKPFLSSLIPTLVDLMGNDFNELKTSQTRIQDVIETEEIAFLRTLERGGNIFQKIIEKADKTISGDDAFLLKDTYGFPIEEILLIAKDSQKSIDLKKYEELEQNAKELSRKSQKTKGEHYEHSVFKDLAEAQIATKFVGYEKTACDANILKIITENQAVDNLIEGQKATLILDQTMRKWVDRLLIKEK